MKVEDLMIGDWVNIYTFPNDNPLEKDLFPAKIVSILDGLPTEQLHTAECIIPNEDSGYGVASRPVETCLPIPLTSEILEVNGIEYHMGAGGYPVLDIEGLSCSVSFNLIKYVHQLQHALCLCGIKKEIVL